MQLARIRETPASTAGMWAIRDLPGVYIYNFRGAWRVGSYPVDGDTELVRRLWPARQGRPDPDSGRAWLAEHRRLGRDFKTRGAALSALQAELRGGGVLGELLCA